MDRSKSQAAKVVGLESATKSSEQVTLKSPTSTFAETQVVRPLEGSQWSGDNGQGVWPRLLS